MLRAVLLAVSGATLALCIALCIREDFDEGNVRGKRVLVTGASTGIGEQLAYQFARLGAHVMVTSRRETVLRQVVARCKQVSTNANQQFHYLAGDMSNDTFYSQLIEAAVARLGGVDYLVLNHIMESPVGQWVGVAENVTMLRHMIDVNFLSYISLASLALPHLEHSAGRLVIVSSVAGRIPAIYNVAYSSTKFALNGFFSGLRHELDLKSSNISVTVCTIGLINTHNTVHKLQTFGLGKLLKHVTPADPSDTALAIVVGGASRRRDVYYPYMSTRSASLAGTLFPHTFEYIENILYGLHGLLGR